MSSALAFAAVVLIAWLNQEQPEPLPPPVSQALPALSPDRVVLLPAPDGKVGRVIISSGERERQLDSAFAGAEIGVAGQIVPLTESAASVRSRYAEVLNALPSRPAVFQVRFVSGRDELTADSLPIIAAMKKEVAQRSNPEIMVIGHTDRVGTLESNDKLSLRRAEAVKQLLMREGVPAVLIETAGRGERQPMTPTADEIAEPLNRRVVIEVR